MAVVGEAHIIVRALTDKVASDIQRGFSGVGSAGRKAGESMGDAFSRGFQNKANNNFFSKFAAGIGNMVPNADRARAALQSMVATGFTLSTTISLIVGAIFSLIAGLGALGGSALGAGAALVSLGNIFGALGLAMMSARLALSGVGKALAALNKGGGGGGASNAVAAAEARAAAAQRVQDAEIKLAQVIEDNRQNLIDANNEVRDSQLELNKAIKEGQEQIQQLGFDAEEAALAEGRAALELDKARETLARTQDLPPNSRARKEAELAFQEAELRLRQAKDRSSDLNKEQDRLARTGVAGTEAVISANQRLAQAEANKAKVIRDSLRNQAQAETDLARARAAAATAGQDGGGGGGGADPYEGLNQFQIAFVNFLAGLKPKLDEIKLAVSEAFLPPLQQAIELLLAPAPFEVFKAGLAGIGGALGNAAISIASAITESKNLNNLSTVFTSSITIIESLGRSLGSVWGIVMTLLATTAPMAERMVQGMEKNLAAFDAFLKRAQADGSLAAFFAKAEYSLNQLKTVISNVLGGIGQIIMANVGPGTGGAMLLDFLIKATEGFKNMNGSATGPGSLKQYFIDVAENTKAVLGFLGELVKALFDLGANQSIKDTFNALKDGQVVENLQSIAEKALAAGPAFADLIESITGIIEKLSDTPSATLFFDVLRTAADALNNILKDKVVANVLAFTSQLFAAGAAFKIIQNVGTFAFEGIAGSVKNVFGVIGGGISTVKDLKFGFDAVKGGAATASEAFKYMSENGNIVTKTIGDLGNGFLKVKDKLVGVGSTLLDGGKKFAGWAAEGAKAAGTAIADAARVSGAWVKENAKIVASFVAEKAAKVASAVATGVMTAAQKIATAAQWLWNAALSANPLGLIIAAIAALVAALVWFFTQTDLGREIWQGFVDFIVGAFQNVVNFFSEAWTNITQFFTDAWNNISSFFTDAINNIVSFVTENWGLLLSILIGPIGLAIQWIVENWDAIMQFLMDAINAFSEWWNGIWSAIGQFISDTWTNIVTFFTDGWNAVWEWILNALTAYVEWWQTIFTGIGQFISDTWNNIVTFFTDGWNAVWNWILSALTAYVQWWQGIFSAIGNFISETWNNIVNFFRDGWNTVWNWILNAVLAYQAWWRGIFQAVGNFISETWNNIVKFFQNGWNTVYNWISTAINNFVVVWKYIFSSVGNFISDVWNNILGFFKNGWNTVYSWITGAINGFVGFWQGAFQGISNFVRDIFNGLVNIIRGPINGIIGVINNMINGLNGIKVKVPDWVPVLGGQTLGFNIPRIPQLAVGGVVMPQEGGTLAQIAEAGRPERVEPLDSNGMSKRDRYMVDLIKAQSGGATINITVNPSAGMDESELASAISREITFQMRRGAVA